MSMRVRRGLLFWGLVLIPLGAIPLLARAGWLDPARLAEAWRLWPLVLIGVGLAILIGRTRAAIVGTAVIALTVGAIGGAVLAAPDDLIGNVTDCIPSGTASTMTRDGSFSDRASVELDLRCGTLDVAVEDGSDWSLTAGYRETEPVVEASSDHLGIRTATGPGSTRDEWSLRLPAEQLNDLDLTLNATSSTLALAGAGLARLVADMNAGDLRIDASDATIGRLDITLNAGRLRLEAGSGPMSGSISANAGSIEVCVPDEVGLELEVANQPTFATNLGSLGLTQSGTTWTRLPDEGASTIQLDLSGNAASLSLKPEGGC